MTKKLFRRSVRTQSQQFVSDDIFCRSEVAFRVEDADVLYQVEGDPEFPYVGKHIANLTLSQIKTLDCGSKRQMDYRVFVAVFGFQEVELLYFFSPSVNLSRHKDFDSRRIVRFCSVH
jgi:hypothetical protein